MLKTETQVVYLVQSAIGHNFGEFQDWKTAHKNAIENRDIVFKVLVWRITGDSQAVICQIWDIFRAGGGASLFIDFYKYLNDEHIETALNRAMAETFPDIKEFAGLDA